MNTDKHELERLRSRNADLVEILEAVERESGWVAKDTPMPVYIGEMRKEMDAAVNALRKIKCIYCGFECSRDDADKLADHITNCDKSPLVQLNKEIQSKAIDLIDMTRDEFIRICALTDDSEIRGICARTQEMIDQKYPVIKQRDDAIRRAEKAERERDAALKCCAEMREAIESLWPHCDLSAFGGSKPKWLIHALSNECGKDYVRKDEVKPLVEAIEFTLESSAQDGPEAIVTCIEKLEQALAHWRKEEE